ncbi:MAG: hypothetical protein ACLFQV_10130 [Vulcanimicrobiota bacterium]
MSEEPTNKIPENENNGEKPQNPPSSAENSEKKDIVKIILIAVLFLAFIYSFVSTQNKRKNEEISRDEAVVKSIMSRSNNTSQTLQKCPVCGKTFKQENSVFQHQIKGAATTFYFDSEKCYTAFLENPGRYYRINRVEVKVKPRTDETEVPGSNENMLEEIPMNEDDNSVIDSPPATSAPEPEPKTDDDHLLHIPLPEEVPDKAKKPSTPDEVPDSFADPLPGQGKSNDEPVIEIIPDKPDTNSEPPAKPVEDDLEVIEIPEGAVPAPQDDIKLEETPIPRPKSL